MLPLIELRNLEPDDHLLSRRGRARPSDEANRDKALAKLRARWEIGIAQSKPGDVVGLKDSVSRSAYDQIQAWVRGEIDFTFDGSLTDMEKSKTVKLQLTDL